MSRKTGPNDAIVDEAVKMMEGGMSTAAIARHIGVHTDTVRRWFKRRGIPQKNSGFGKKFHPQCPDPPALDDGPEEAEKEEGGDEDPIQTEVDVALEEMAQSVAMKAKFEAITEEDKTLAEIAAAQSTPADKYQAYISAAAIKLLRDSIKGLRGPRTVRELSELDQLIRRNLGLNAKGGGGGGGTKIDISILTNTKADKGDGSLSKLRKQAVFEAEIIDE